MEEASTSVGSERGGAGRPGSGYDLAPSPEGAALLARVVAFIRDEVDPMAVRYDALAAEARGWDFAPGQLELLDGVKAKAKAAGLWNLFLPDPSSGVGITNLDYAHIAQELGKSPLASECLNCSAPDTGNMEVLERVGTPEQKERWLAPLLDGVIRSCYAMTEPGTASSDARNISTTAVRDGDTWVVDGEKHFITGAGDPRCAVMICMARTDPDASPHHQHTQFLIPMATPGVEVVGPMHVFGQEHAPHGHMHLRLTDVRVPDEAVLLGRGRGFEVSQLRLGPGRLHHCMRAVGVAERALGLMVARGIEREAFGRPLAALGKNTELIARARIDIEAMRLMVLRAARAMDVSDPWEARVWVSAVKAMVPERVCLIIDQAIQVHGAAGLSRLTPLADMYVWMRSLRLADGPDDVHQMVVGRAEIARVCPAGEGPTGPSPTTGRGRSQWTSS